MEMTHVIYLTTIVLLVAAGGYLIWELNEKLNLEKEMLKITERQLRKQKDRVWRLEKENEQLKEQIKQLEKHINCIENIWDGDIGEWEKSMSKYESEITALTAKLQSAYGRIGALTQQLNRLKEAKKAVKSDVKKADAEKVELPKECPDHLFEKFPEDIRQMAWEASCSLRPERAKRACEIKVCYCLSKAFEWIKTPQGHKFWQAWYIWQIYGADPNRMPPRDPNDPMYK